MSRSRIPRSVCEILRIICSKMIFILHFGWVISIFISALIYSILRGLCKRTVKHVPSSFRPDWLCKNGGNGYWVGLWKFDVLEQPEATTSPRRFCSIFFL
jgi:hypothetical protein